MHDTTDLHAQRAQRLFGWESNLYGVWGKPIGENRYAVVRQVPAYSTDPAATAQVWQWVEARLGPDNWQITMAYQYGRIWCRLSDNRVITLASADGATWPDALCRAALALAEARERPEQA